MIFIGAHIARQKTLEDTINKIIENGGNSLQIFVSNPRSCKITELNEKFFQPITSKKSDFSLIIHSPYIINIATPFMNNKRTIDIKDCYWIKLIIHELKIADLIGAYGCIIHCGKYTSNLPEAGLVNMKMALEFIINEIKCLKLKSKIILETSSGQGTELLSNYHEFLDFYNTFSKDEKKYFKICIDTCHVWASGFELSEIFQITEANGNLNDIAVIHINNSKNPINSHLDRHDVIHKGFIDLNEILKFTKLMKKANNKITFILETPDEPNLNREFELFTNI